MFIVQATRHREGFKLLGAMTKIRIAHIQKINFALHFNFMFSDLYVKKSHFEKFWPNLRTIFFFRQESLHQI
jgi:hypothetical protein